MCAALTTHLLRSGLRQDFLVQRPTVVDFFNVWLSPQRLGLIQVWQGPCNIRTQTSATLTTHLLHVGRPPVAALRCSRCPSSHAGAPHHQELPSEPAHQSNLLTMTSGLSTHLAMILATRAPRAEWTGSSTLTAAPSGVRAAVAGHEVAGLLGV